MSDNYYCLIPTVPHYVPSGNLITRAQALFASFVPDADEVQAVLQDDVFFRDQGSNFDRVVCPRCGRELEVSWWQRAMDISYKTNFVDLTVTTPCCELETTLNDLHYYWPAGFARFALQARNPGIRDLSREQFASLEKALGCTLRRIWAHY